MGKLGKTFWNSGSPLRAKTLSAEVRMKGRGRQRVRSPGHLKVYGATSRVWTGTHARTRVCQRGPGILGLSIMVLLCLSPPLRDQLRRFLSSPPGIHRGPNSNEGARRTGCRVRKQQRRPWAAQGCWCGGPYGLAERLLTPPALCLLPISPAKCSPIPIHPSENTDWGLGLAPEGTGNAEVRTSHLAWGCCSSKAALVAGLSPFC